MGQAVVLHALALPGWLVFVFCFAARAKFSSVLSSQALPATWINNTFRDTRGQLDVIVMAGPFPLGWSLSQCY